MHDEAGERNHGKKKRGQLQDWPPPRRGEPTSRWLMSSKTRVKVPANSFDARELIHFGGCRSEQEEVRKGTGVGHLTKATMVWPEMALALEVTLGFILRLGYSMMPEDSKNIDQSKRRWILLDDSEP